MNRVQAKQSLFFTLDSNYQESAQFSNLADLPKILMHENIGKTILIKRCLVIDMVRF